MPTFQCDHEILEHWILTQKGEHRQFDASLARFLAKPGHAQPQPQPYGTRRAYGRVTITVRCAALKLQTEHRTYYYHGMLAGSSLIYEDIDSITTETVVMAS